MALSEQVAELEKKVRELEQEVARLRALQVPCDPRPGDVWYFATNHKDGRRKDLWLMTVSRVVPDRDEVWFEDGGWNTLSGMRGPGWFLVGRKYQDGDEDRLLEKFLGR